ncbi:MAG: biotin synthase BioB [Deltaproteobacteria bacterium]|jgi:biotin synthase|nr:biotin synthase BioB [Deltaproteobacteria bacterium]
MTLGIGDLKRKISAGGEWTLREALSVLADGEFPLEDILGLAGSLRQKYWGRKVSIQVITSTKNGSCTEDCAYCAQGTASAAPLDSCGFLSKDQLREKARLTESYPVRRHCLGFSGIRFEDEEIEIIARQIESLKDEFAVPICCSIGLLTPGQAARLKKAGVSRINHNLNTSARFYSRICTTHTYEERLANLKLIKSAGLEICSGGIAGMGEEPEDTAEMLLALRKLEPDSVPINFYVPIYGTTLAARRPPALAPEYCLRVLALARFLMPRAEIRCAAGREKYLSRRTAEVLAAVDSIFAQGYLTIGGSGLDRTLEEIEKAGYTAAWN